MLQDLMIDYNAVEDIIFLMTSVFREDLYKGKVVLVSGGATGICYEIVREFLKHGATVHIISRKIDNINRAVASLKAETGSKLITGSSCDVRKEESVEATVKEVVARLGEIDVLVNGAAGNFLAPYQDLSPNAFRTVLMIDTVGTFLLSKYTTQHAMKKGGVIINITAHLHYNGTALQSHAGTAKAGVDALTKHLAVELGPRGIRVIGVCPGAIEGTEGFDRLTPKGAEGASMGDIIPLQRGGHKVDIANSCLFVASPAASYITGTVLIVDGGIVLTAPNFTFLSPEFVKGYPKFGKL